MSMQIFGIKVEKVIKICYLQRLKFCFYCDERDVAVVCCAQAYQIKQPERSLLRCSFHWGRAPTLSGPSEPEKLLYFTLHLQTDSRFTRPAFKCDSVSFFLDHA